MPCYADPHSYCSHEKGECNEIKEFIIHFYENEQNLIKNINNVTNLLCESMKLHENIKTEKNFFSDELNKWWDSHKKFDNNKCNDFKEILLYEINDLCVSIENDMKNSMELKK